MVEHREQPAQGEGNERREAPVSPVESLTDQVHGDLNVLLTDAQRAKLKVLDDILAQEGITPEQHQAFRAALLRLKPELWEDIGFFKGKVPSKGGILPMKAFYVPKLRSLPLHPEIEPPSFVHEVNHHFWYEKMTEAERQAVAVFHAALTPDEIVQSQYANHAFARNRAHEWLAQAYATWFYGLQGNEKLREPKFQPIVQLFERFERSRTAPETRGAHVP